MRTLMAAVFCALSMSTAQTAVAQTTFHVKEFDFDKGSWVFETINAGMNGFPVRADRVRSGHELGLGYGVTSWWLPKILLSFETPVDDSLHVQRVLFENIFKLKNLAEGKDGFGVAWFQSVEGALRRDETNATLFGPILTGQLGKFSASVNPFLEKTFGQNRENGMSFVWAVQGRYEIADKIKIGIESYGTVPEIGGRSTGAGTQHRFGPVLIVETELGGMAHGGRHGTAAGHSVKTAGSKEPAHAEIEFGVLFGTTDATPDLTGKVNMHIKF